MKSKRTSPSMASEFTQECNTAWLCWLGMPLEYDGFVTRDIPTYEEQVRWYKVWYPIFHAGTGIRRRGLVNMNNRG